MTDRISILRNKLSEWKIDGILIESPNNYRWLSGFTGSRCSLLITQTQALLGTDFRYWDQAINQSPDFELVKLGNTADLKRTGDMIVMSGAKRLGIEGNHVTLTKFEVLKDAVKDLESFEFVTLTDAVEGLRLSKSEAEIDMIRQAARITDMAMDSVPEIAKPGMTERELAWELEKRMREAGADGVAFDIIVASGPNAAMAHHRPGDRQFIEGEPILIDMGALLNGYHSDLTRTFYLGNTPDQMFKYVYDLVLAAQTNALENIKAGQIGKDVDNFAREVIDDAGQGDKFGHSLGHGVGLDIHELPRFSSTYEEEVPAGSIMSVEPGVYLPEWGGVRIEDLVVVTEDGVEIISQAKKDPIIKTN